MVHIPKERIRTNIGRLTWHKRFGLESRPQFFELCKQYNTLFIRPIRKNIITFEVPIFKKWNKPIKTKNAHHKRESCYLAVVTTYKRMFIKNILDRLYIVHQKQRE